MMARGRRWPLAALGLALAACGGTQPPPSGPGPGPGPGSDEPAGVVRDTRTPLERRRHAACDQLEPKLVQCAVDDVRAKLAAGKITQQQFEADTSPELQRGLAQDWHRKCRKGYMSSRQVRVLEVCFREETACAPLEACLEHLKATNPGGK
jgi:hypothetical protein